MRVSRAATLARTAARLRTAQLVMRPYARLAIAVLPAVTRVRSIDRAAIGRFEAWVEATSPWDKAAASEEARRAMAGEWRYIGVSVFSPTGPLSFPGKFPSRLWEYEFRYRRWLEGLAMLSASGEITRDDVLATWNRADRDAVRADYEPYVLARRLWSEATAAGLLKDASRLPQIDREVRILRAMPELHILANHVLADRAAVAAISVLLQPQAVATRKALDDYADELELQVDSDGFHEERSPSYHLIALHDLKRVIAAIEVTGIRRYERRFAAQERVMTNLLKRLLHPDGSSPMFHDSAAFTAPSANDLGIAADEELASKDLRSSGFSVIEHRIAREKLRIIADFGSPRPPHQPGHQHAAPFAFELWWDGSWISSAGVSTYAPGPRRLFERGASAHACLRVDHRDPAETWSAFRMGRGYEVSSRRFVDNEKNVSIAASHDGYAPAIVRRMIALDKAAGLLTITDEVTGSKGDVVESFLPLAPEVRASEHGGGLTLIRGGRSVDVTVSGARLEVRPFEVARRFGEPESSHVIVMTADRSDALISMTFSFRSDA